MKQNKMERNEMGNLYFAKWENLYFSKWEISTLQNGKICTLQNENMTKEKMNH